MRSVDSRAANGHLCRVASRRDRKSRREDSRRGRPGGPRHSFKAPFLVVVALFVALPSSAQPRPPKEHSDGVIVGKIVNSRGEPVAGAWVSLDGYVQPPPGVDGQQPERLSRHGPADASGRIRFHNLPNGSYNFQARLAGHHFQGSRGENVQLQGPKAEGSFELRFPRKPVLTGRVFDPAGVPLDRVRVQALRRTIHEGREVLTPAQIATTDDRGVYRIALSEPGRYWLQASHTERSFPRGSAPRATGIAFYPNAPDLLSAAPIDVAFDQEERTLDIGLPSAPATLLVAAIVTGPGGRPCVQCRYSLRKVEGEYEYDIVSGGSGQRSGFDYAGVPSGHYRIYVDDHGQNPGWWAIGETTLTEGHPAEVLVATQPPIAISGRVVVEEPPKDLGADAVTNVHVEPIDNRTFFGSGRDSKNSIELKDGDTEFQIGPFAPGRFRLRVWARGANAYVSGISREGRPLPSPVLDLTQPGAWDNLEVHLRFDPVNVKPEIAKTADPNKQYRVALVPTADNSYGARQEAVCGPAAFCGLSGVPPGRYDIVAIDAVAGNEANFHDPATWKKLGAWTKTLTLTAGESPAIQLEPAPASALAQN